ncbi:SMP-30/gluconolactonase/LRE family protein [Mesorhizobium sp. L-8-3]|uniref:SMP-30/gluconolactonase/LRE family protein n=1 Tax=Mesorhizobium sp. L-8-3 TaxID=2744522 RepID=UPI001926140B|nr:SMP-30/gluconolactonase/LRE family protein [Mesorhizobium sp. L-8-3]BCH23891.1 Smp-30/Cgr1 family protein [Mesorhizobium sp. L-8-3]
MTLDVRCISERPDFLGESPVWDADNNWLYWVDGFSRLVRRWEPATGSFREWSTPSMVGSVALGLGDCVVVGLVDGIFSLDLGNSSLAPLLKPEPADPLVRFNDGKTDRDGRFLCGSMGIHADPRGILWRIDAAGRRDSLADGIRISNALCFSPDGATMYFADSLDRTIRAYPYGADGVGEPTILVDTAQWNSGPDGATVDSDGCIWATLVQVGKIARITPDGRLDRMIDAPVDLPSSVAFGGDDMATLFVTSIKDSGSGRAVSKHPDGGKLFAIDGLAARGIAEARFGQSALENNKTEAA